MQNDTNQYKRNPFIIMFDAPAIVVGTVLVQADNKG